MKKLMPTSYFLILLTLLILLHFILPVMKFDYAPWNYAGIILILFGGITNLWTDSLMKKVKTTVKPHLKPSSLIVAGPFKFTRHPMYLGMCSILTGAAIIASSLISFILPLVYIALMEILFIPMEEKNLMDTFGESYTQYRKKVRKWI